MHSWRVIVNGPNKITKVVDVNTIDKTNDELTEEDLKKLQVIIVANKILHRDLHTCKYNQISGCKSTFCWMLSFACSQLQAYSN